MEQEKQRRKLTYEAKRAGYEYKPPTEPKPILSRVIDIVRRGETAPGVMAALEGKDAGKALLESTFGKYQKPEEIVTYEDVLEKVGWKTESRIGKFVRGAAGLALDIVLDPKTYLTLGIGGAMKIGKGVSKVAISKPGTQLLKKTVGQFGRELTEAELKKLPFSLSGKQLLKKSVKQFGKTMNRDAIEQMVKRQAMRQPGRLLDLGAGRMSKEAIEAMVIRKVTGKGGEKYLAKGGLKFMGKTLPGTEKLGELAGRGARKIPGVNQALDLYTKALTPFKRFAGEKIPGMAGVRTWEDYTEAYFKWAKGTRFQQQEFIKNAMRTRKKMVKKYGKKVGKSATEAIEAGTETGMKSLDAAIDWMTKTQKKWGKEAIGRDLMKGELPNYVKRILTPHAQKQLRKGGKITFGVSSTTKAKLQGSQFGRKILKFVSGDEEFIGTAQKMGLTEFNKPKEIAKFKGMVDNMVKGKEVKIKAFQRQINKLEKKGLHIAVKPDKVKELPDVISGIIKTKAGKLKDVPATLGTRDTKKFVNALVDLPDKQIAKLKKMVGKREEWVGDLWKDIDRIRDISKKRIKALPEERMFYKGGELYKGKQAKIVSEINPWAKKELGFELFEEDAFKSFSMRGAEQIKGVETDKFLKNIIGQEFGQPLRFETKLMRNPLSKKIEKIKEFLPTKIDGVEFMPTNIPQLKGIGVPKMIKDHLEQVYKVVNSDDVASGFLATYDKAMGFFKRNVTGVWPAFHSRNFIGGSFNNWLAGVKNPVRYLQGHNIARGHDGFITTKMGQKISYKQIREESMKRGALGMPGMMDTMKTLNEMTETGAKKAIKQYPQMFMETVEDRLRYPLIIERLVQGDNFDQAVKQVFKYHFDYSPEALSKFEQGVMKRVIPFYTWTRNNLPLQLEQLIKKPGKYASFFKTIRTAEKQLGSDKELIGEEKGLFPSWLAEMLTIRLPGFSKEGTPRYLQLDLPLEDFNKLPFTESGRRELLAMLSPILKYPVERFMNKNIYYDSEIYDKNVTKDLQTSTTFANLEALPEPIKKFLKFRVVKSKNVLTGKTEKRYEMDARMLHTVQSFLGRYYYSGKQLFEKGIPAWEKAFRLGGGVPIRRVDTQQQAYWKSKEEQDKMAAQLREIKRQE